MNSHAVSGSNVYVVWVDNSPGNDDIFYKRSLDGGASFAAEINLSTSLGTSVDPSISVSGDNVYVVWMDNTDGNFEVFYKRSLDGGASFEQTENLSDNAGNSLSPAIVSIGDVVHVVWQDNEPGNFEIFYRRSLDAGSSFFGVENLSDNPGSSELPAIAAVGSGVHVVWQDDTSAQTNLFDILYRRSLDAGFSFFDVENLSDPNTAPSTAPTIAAIGNNVHVAWMDSAGASDIFYTRSLDEGGTFSNIENISDNAGCSFRPAIAVLGNNVYLVWSDNTIGNFDILYRRSTNNGATFSDILTNLSLNMGTSEGPAIAASDQNL